MKKLLLVLVCMSVTSLGWSQTYKHIVVQVLNGGMNVPNHRVWVETYLNGNAIEYRSGYTDSTQYSNYGDSISTSMAFDSLKTYTYDCNGNKVYGVAGGMPSGIFGFHDTISVPCPLNGFSGKVNLLYTQSSTQPNAIDFVDNTVGSGIAGTSIWRSCFFGDNDSAVVSSTFSHTYPGPGKYYMTFLYIESNTQGLSLVSTFRDTVEVLPFNPPTFCQAAYSVDTVNSGNGFAFVYNTSTPSTRDSNYTTSYHWDFGDGDTSNQAFPAHSYTSSGVYEVCLTVTSIDSVGAVCASNFCDTLGIDSLGNLVYKNSGFTLQVLDPTVGIDELTVQSNFEIYPNPFNDVLRVRSLSGDAHLVNYSVTDLKGAMLEEGVIKSDDGDLNLNLEKMQRGVYILHLRGNKGELYHQKIIKR